MISKSTPFLIILALLTLPLQKVAAQTTVDVTVSNNVYTPANITINVGDTVRWTNIQGNHNVNGTQATYPNNPESFGNAVAGPGWVLTHVFNTPGSYDYRCDPHLFVGMTGTVTVNDVSTSLNEYDAMVPIVFPNPANHVVNFRFNDQAMLGFQQANIILFDQLGKQHRDVNLLERSDIQIDVAGLHSGLYVYQVWTDGRIVHSGKLIVK
ncbi:MAG: T9SS C-terminal target domain-containing protein [Cryomorphaceae bacterium]|nr:MAG: T9SS C-terminal target domain-containing protein [Cryomorphaceae bacterium]